MAIFPVTRPPIGNYSEDPGVSVKFATDVLLATWNMAQASANAFDDIITEATQKIDAQSDGDTLSIGSANETPVLEPAISIPTSADPGDVMSLFDQKYLELVALLTEKFTGFLMQYFPNDGANYALAESWIADAISNPDHGIPASVAAQMMTDTKTRAYADASTQSEAVLETFAARGYPLPPGAAANAVLQIHQKAQDSISEASRKLMTDSVEQMRFAITKAMEMRKDAIGSAISYINALAAGPSLASSLVNTGYDAQSKLISATASFYNARTNASQLLKQAEQFNVDRKFSKDERNVSNDIALTQENVKLLLNEAQALAQIATSLFNNLNVSTSVSV